MTTTMLSHVSTQLKTLDPAFPDDYTQGVILCHWSERGRTRITLDGNELYAVLSALPTDMLVAALEKRGMLCTMRAEARSSDKSVTSAAGDNTMPDWAPIVAAALAWWEWHRPLGWTKAQHEAQACINCTKRTDSRLAEACAAYVGGKTDAKRDA